MKIGIYDPYLDDLGGGEKYMMTIASILSNKHKIFVFWDHKKDIEDIQKRFAIDFSKISLTKNIFSPHIGSKTRLLESKKYDAIIYLSDGSLPLVFKRNLLVHIQQPLDRINTSSLIDKIKLSKVKLFFCNSEYTKSFIANKVNKKIMILYPPVPLHPKDIEKENIILHVGRFRTKNISMDDYKKQFFMVQQFREMVDKGLKSWTFVVATSIREDDKEEFAKMQELAKGYPISFYVNKTNSQLWDLYSKAKIYWHASGYGEDLSKHPEHAEHFGISTVEAMGAGAVPVVINAGGQKEIVTDERNGLLWNTAEEMQKKTLQLINDQKLLHKLSQAAQNRAEDFSLGAFTKKLHEIIQ